jgi:hypothetical protein
MWCGLKKEPVGKGWVYEPLMDGSQKSKNLVLDPDPQFSKGLKKPFKEPYNHVLP